MIPDKMMTKIDERGRITIPKPYRQFMTGIKDVMWKFTGKKLIVYFGDVEDVEFISTELLYNKNTELVEEIKTLDSKFKQLQKMVWNEITEKRNEELRKMNDVNSETN